MEEPPETIVEARKEHMVSPGGDGNPTLRTAHFLKPSIALIDENIPKHPSHHSPSSLPSVFEPRSWPLNVNFHGWRYPQRNWKAWADKMAACYESTWKKAGIFEAVMNSTYQIQRNNDLVLGLGEKWCSETNTFIFPWAEATITLEDMMVAGYSLLGSPVFSPLETEDLKEMEQKLIALRKELNRTKAKKACHCAWIKYAMENKSEFEHEAFLSLWLARFVFPTNIETVSKHVLPIAVRLARGIKVALAPAVLANIYRDLSLLKGKIVALSKLETLEDQLVVGNDKLELTIWSPFHIVQVWAWERFTNLQPKPNLTDFEVPKLAGWHKVNSSGLGINVRLALDSGGNFLWRPYATAEYNLCCQLYDDKGKWVSVDIAMEEELESFARCLRPSELVGIGCIEQYSPHRVAMQFGMDQDLPDQVTRCNETQRIAWNCYNKPIMDSKLYIPSPHFKPEVTLRYSKWWKESMLGGKDACRSPKSLRNFQATSKGKEKDNYPFNPPGVTPKFQHFEAWDSSSEEDNLTVKELLASRNKTRNVGNGMDDKEETLLGTINLSSSSEESCVVIKESLMKPDEKNTQSEPLSRKKRRTRDDANEGKADAPFHDVDTVKDNEGESGNKFSIQTSGLEIEARIRRLEKEFDKLKSARLGHGAMQIQTKKEG